MKFAIKVAYSGVGFDGSQKQPGKRTVQSELEAVLGTVKSASRTDAGVSALGAVFVFEAEAEPNINRLNQLLPEDIIALDIMPVPDSFNPRHAEMKHYRYYLPAVGKETNLKNMEFKLPSKTKLEKITVDRKGKFVVFDLFGPHFGYRAVRKIIGEILGTGAVPPWGLLLMDIRYPELKFCNRVKDVFRKKFEKDFKKHLQVLQVITDLTSVKCESVDQKT